MVSEWGKVSLGDVFNVKHGFAFKGEFFVNEPTATILVTPGNFAVGGGFQNPKPKFYNGPVPEGYVLEPGQVLVTMTDLSKQSDTLGYPALVPEDENTWLHNQRVGLLEFKNKYPCDPIFINYFLRSHDYRSWIIGSASGTTVKHTSPDRIMSYRCEFPPLPEQKAIAHVLGSLDDRIELNRRTNETLEAMAQALFKSWFVDFDPVIDNALAGGKEIPAELSEKAQARAVLGDKRRPLPEKIRTLFPDEFTYSDELDWIPKGWEVKTIDDAIEVNPRVQLKKGEVAKFVDMKALPTSGFSVADVITKSYSGGAKFNNGDVLLARITPCLENGKTGVVDFLDDGEVGFGSTEFIVLRGKGAIHMPFIACLARHTKFRDHCTQSMVGSSGRQRVQNACFSYFYLALPPENNLLNTFNELAEGTFEKYVQLRKQSKVLSNLRDILLPKLLSGELRIPDAERMVAELAL